MKRQLPLFLAVSLLASSVAQALGLGPIERRSALNQPFDARIPITGASVEELDAIRVGLAGSEQFQRAGVERGLLATQLRFELIQPPKGSDYIRVTTRDPIREPFVSFLVEVNWSAGRLFREYTVLLDPPEFKRQALTVNAPAARQPVRPAATSVATGPTARPLPTTGGAPVPTAVTPAPMPAAAPDATSAPGERRVERGDTLWEIAQEVASREGATVHQALVSVWRANPEAFAGGNMNALKSGAILRLPDAATLSGLSNAEALAMVRQQNSQWESYRSERASETPPAQAPAATAPVDAVAGTTPASTGESPDIDSKLELLAPSKADAGAAGEAGLKKELDLTREEIESRKGENAELNARLADAEKLIEKLERALELRNDELARLQSQLGQPASKPEVPADAPSTDEPAPAPETPAATPPESTPSAEATPLEDLIDAPVAPMDDATDAPATAGAPPEAATDDVPAPTDQPAATVDAPTDAPTAGPETPATPTEPATDTPADATAGPTDAPATPAEVETDATTDLPEAPTAAATTPAEPVAPTQPVEPKPEAAKPAAVAPSPKPRPDALVELAESIVPPDVAAAVPGGALAVLGGAAAALLALFGLVLARSTGRRTHSDLVARDAQPESGAPLLEDGDATQLAPVTSVTAAPATVVPIELQTLEAPLTALVQQAPEPVIDDSLTEVNVYLAYEQYTQAEALVRGAIAKHPDDPRMYLRLLEVFYASGDTASFERAAGELNKLTGGQGPHWEDALKLWSEMSPGRALFASPDQDATLDRSQTEAVANRAFVDITAAEPEEELESTLNTNSPVAAEEGDFTRTVIISPGAKPDLPAAPQAEPLDFDLGDSLAQETVESAPQAASNDLDFFDPGSLDDASASLETGDMGLDFSTDGTPPQSGRALDDDMLDISGGGLADMTLLDITAATDANAGDYLSLAAGSQDFELLDITGGSDASDPTALSLQPMEGEVETDFLDISAGSTNIEEAAAASAASETFDLNPSADLLDLTSSGMPGNNELRDMLDVSLEGSGLGDLLDVSKPGVPAALTMGSTPAAPDSTVPGTRQQMRDELMATQSLDMPLEFNLSGLSSAPSLHDAPAAPPSEPDPTDSIGLPSITAADDFENIEDERTLVDTFEMPQSDGIANLGFDETSSADELAQALEDTASRLKVESSIQPLSDFADFNDEFGFGSEGPEPVPEPANAGLDFDIGGGGADYNPSEDLQTLVLPAASPDESLMLLDDDSESLSLDITGDNDIDDLSTADGWLNLAHAYIEIGDHPSARAELERVLQQGNASQQEAARALLQQIAD